MDGADGVGFGEGDGDSVPLPLDHFFFCFLPPVAEGACHVYILVCLSRRLDDRGVCTHHFVCWCGWFEEKRWRSAEEIRKWPWGVTKQG